MLHIVHLNDTEGRAYDAWPRLAAAARRLQRAGRCDLLLHAGDVSLAAPFADAAVELLGRLGLVALVPGNHDFDAGVRTLREKLASSRAAALCANAAGPAAACFRSHLVVERGGYRVALLGVTLPHMALLQPDRNVGGLSFLDPDAAVRDLTSRLRGQADLVVLLSHCGLELDRELAQIPGVDLIVGGHSHHLLRRPIRAGRAWIVQAGEAGEYAGWAAVRGIGGTLDVTGGVLATAGLQPDAEALMLAPAEDDGPDAVVGQVAEDLRRDDYAGETPPGNLTADLMREAARADVALLRCASVSTSIGPGPLRRRDLALLNTCGTDRLARMELTGRELLDVLERGAREAYLLLTTSGARVVYDAGRPAGRRVVEVTVAGAPLAPERRYAVACSEILARGGSAFTPLRGKPYDLLPCAIQDLLARHVAHVGTLRPQIDGRLVIRGSLPRRSRDPA